MVSISQRSEELRLYNMVWNLTISNPGLKAVSSNASPGWTVCFFGGDDRGFLKEGVKTRSNDINVASWINSPTLFLRLYHIHGLSNGHTLMRASTLFWTVFSLSAASASKASRSAVRPSRKPLHSSTSWWDRLTSSHACARSFIFSASSALWASSTICRCCSAVRTTAR